MRFSINVCCRDRVVVRDRTPVPGMLLKYLVTLSDVVAFRGCVSALFWDRTYALYAPGEKTLH